MRRFLSLPVDWSVLFIPILLTITGIVTIYTITFAEYQTSLAIDQAIFAGIGFVAMLLIMFYDYRFLFSIGGLLFVVGLITLLPLLPFWAEKLPFVLKIYGAHRWLDFGIFQVQPAEIFKLIAAIFGAKLLSDKIGRLNWKTTLIYIVIAIFSFGLVLLQPDLGTASVLLAIFGGLFLAALPSRRTILVLLALAIIAVPVMWSNLKPYQKTRLETFINPTTDPQGVGYNVRQSLIAVGSGGLMGRGFGQGSQTVLNFLPVPHADFIFAGFAEATGFLGSIVMVGLYTFLILRAIGIAKISVDPFGQLLAIAIAAKFTFQVAVHIGMNIGLLPVTGIPLPFMSYGGTALIVDLTAIGILQSIYFRHKRSAY